MSPDEYQHQPDESPDIHIFALAPFFSHLASVVVATLFIIGLAFVFPWNGGATSIWFGYLYYATVAASLYAFWRGYTDLFRQGLLGWHRFLWSIAIVVSIGVTIDIVLFGLQILGMPVVMPGAVVLMSGTVFYAVVGFQAVYFLFESITSLFVAYRSSDKNMEGWYRAIYLFILAMNSASVILGLLIVGYIQVLR